jgi:hypothetical protein
LSTLVQLQKGETAETLVIGSEGMVGLSVWLGLSTSLEHVLQQAPGEILRILARIFCVVTRFSDAAISGGTATRPGYQALLTAARRRDFDIIVTEDISRCGATVRSSARDRRSLRTSAFTA